MDTWVRDYMSKDVVSCPVDTTLAEVLEELRSRVFSCLVVVEGNSPVGIVSERDLVHLFADLESVNGWGALLVNAFMTSPVNCLEEDLTIIEAVESLRHEGVKHAPVVDMAGCLVGLLTQTDVINGLYRTCIAREA